MNARFHPSRFLLVALFGVVACESTPAEPQNPAWADVAPIFRGECNGCHGWNAGQTGGGYRFDFFDVTESVCGKAARALGTELALAGSPLAPDGVAARGAAHRGRRRDAKGGHVAENAAAAEPRASRVGARHHRALGGAAGQGTGSGRQSPPDHLRFRLPGERRPHPDVHRGHRRSRRRFGAGCDRGERHRGLPDEPARIVRRQLRYNQLAGGLPALDGGPLRRLDQHHGRFSAPSRSSIELRTARPPRTGAQGPEAEPPGAARQSTGTKKVNTQLDDGW